MTRGQRPGKLYGRGVQTLASLGHTGRRRVVLGHTLNTLQHIITKKSHNILSKFTILGQATFIATLGQMQPVGHGWDAPAAWNRGTQTKHVGGMHADLGQEWSRTPYRIQDRQRPCIKNI